MQVWDMAWLASAAAALLSAQARGEELPALRLHLTADTGLGREGCAPQDLVALAEAVCLGRGWREGIRVEGGVDEGKWGGGVLAESDCGDGNGVPGM